MKLEGAYDVPAPRQKVWDAFQDPQQLKQAIPGCEKLEAIGPDEYKATMKVGVGGVKGTFEGKVRLSDKNPPESYKMAVEGSGGPGFIRGETVITLTEAGGGTRVAYTADLQVG
ncbi:MAG: carbon monoxide dehydrogenase, partial [Candidatus Rokuibacteriota bacterium]